VADVLPSGELTDEPSDFGALRPSTRLGRYELLVPIARGGMARVWAARQHGQRGFQKLVAIKTILPHLAEEAEFERMFLDEARIASGVHHPNVCEIYELGEDKRTLYLAMEWVSGDSLSRVLRASGKTEALDPRVAARIIADACAGVHAAHELTDDDGRPLEVVHRDLSPHNVLLTGDGVAKVCDFGVAKALGQLHEQTSAGQLKGKISYMSPEQVTGGAIDRRSDVFSLGCVLYEATTGVRPFKGEQDHMVMHAILSGELQPPTSVVRNYPLELERIVLRALAHQPILRFPTAERMRFALEEFLAKGQLVTQSNVAQVVRARLGEQLDRRKERIKQASSVVEQGAWDPASAGTTRDAVDHRSGVKPSRPLNSTGVAHDAVFEVAPPTSMPPTPRMPPPLPPSAGHTHTPSNSSPSIRPPLPSVATMPPMSGPHGPHDPVLPPGNVALTYPIGPGGMMSPIGHPGVPSPPADYSRPGRHGERADWSSSGHGPGPAQQTIPPASGSSPGRHGERADWSSSGYGPGPAQHTIPPISGLSPSNPYGNPAIYDGANALPPEGVAEPQQPQAGAGQYALAAFVGLLFALLIGGGGFFIWHARAKQAPTPPPAPTEVAAPAPSPPTSATVPAAAPAVPVAIDATPADAILIVDGNELPPETRSIPRPAEGQTVTVLLRAKGHDDASIEIDSSMEGPIEIALRPIAENTAPAASAVPDISTAAASSAKAPSKPRPREPSALPDNPY